MAVIQKLREPILPDTAFIIWDKQAGKVVKAGLLISQRVSTNFWDVISKEGEALIDFDLYTNNRYLILDGRHYDENPDEIFDLPRVPRVDVT